MRNCSSSARMPRLFGLCVGLGLGLVGAAKGSPTASAAEPAAPSAHGSGPSPRSGAKAGSESQTRARRMFQDAEAHFQAGLFAEALGEYQAGYDAAALPGFLINIAQCQRRLGNLTGALTTYRKFIMVAPDSPYVPQVKALVTDLEKLARDDELQRDRERAASAKPATPASEPEAPALIDRPNGVATPPQAEKDSGRRASSTRWWWIGGAGALVALAGGTAAVFALRSGDSTTLHDGSLGSLRR